MDLNYEAEIYKGGLLTSAKIVKHERDLIQVTFKKYLRDENGKELIDSSFSMFFSDREFREFFLPIVNELKVRFDNDNSISNG
jgi:hypothetical protein